MGDQVHLKYHTQLSDSITQILGNRYFQIFAFGESAASSQDLVTISSGWIKICANISQEREPFVLTLYLSKWDKSSK